MENGGPELGRGGWELDPGKEWHQKYTAWGHNGTWTRAQGPDP